MKTHLNDLGRMVVKSAHLYRPMFKQTFPVIFIFLLFQELVSTVLLDSSFAKELFSPLLTNILVSSVNFFCSVFLMGYLMSEAYSALHRQKGNRNSHLAYTAKYFSRLVGVALTQSMVIFAVVAFYVFLSNLIGLDQIASQEIIIGFFVVIAFITYTFVSQIPPLLLFKHTGIWEALNLSLKTIKTKFFLASLVMLLNISILLLPSLLFFEIFADVFKIESLGVQQVLHIFLSTALMPMVQLILMHLYAFLFERAAK